MSQLLKSPSQYVQGSGVLAEFDKYLDGMGNKILVLISASGMKRIAPTLDTCFEGKDYTARYEVFEGESTQATIDRIVGICKDEGITAVAGVGGGKILDSAKAIAHYAELPCIIVPTVASTDSPCSSLSIIYHENGEFDRYLFLKNCPDLVLVDVDVIVKAPVKLLVAGMGDALATYFEARACRASGKNNQVHAKPTLAASGMAAQCWEYLKRDGLRAKQAVEAGVCTKAVEAIVEVNTYLSSVGFESGGLAAAHGIQKGFTFVPELHDLYHGDKVAFCTIVQLILEDTDETELNDVLGFCKSVGLPICFADMGYTEVNRETLRLAADKACVPTSTIHNMPFEVTAKMVYEAMIAADAVGTAFHNK